MYTVIFNKVEDMKPAWYWLSEALGAKAKMRSENDENNQKRKVISLKKSTKQSKLPKHAILCQKHHGPTCISHFNTLVPCQILKLLESESVRQHCFLYLCTRIEYLILRIYLINS